MTKWAIMRVALVVALVVGVGVISARPAQAQAQADLTGLSVPTVTITRTTAEAEATLDNQDDQAVTVYFRYRTPPTSGTWSSVHDEAISGESADYSLTGLSAGTQYRLQASLDNTFPSDETEHVDFTTASNSAPIFESLEVLRAVDENVFAGHEVGEAVSASDADNDTLTYSLYGVDASSFALHSSTGQITVGATTTLDYETKASYTVTVTATDTFSASATTTVTITVNDLREAGVLGRIVLTIGGSGTDYGYSAGSYGNLDLGSFPGALFGDGTARTVSEVYENANGEWFFVYTGGTTQDWNDDEEALSEITIEVTNENGTDFRSFVIAGFIAERSGNYTLKLTPPLPSRDWEARDGDQVLIDFVRHRGQVISPVRPAAETEPTGDPDSFVEFLSATTPGGPVMAQTLIVIMVYTGFLFKSPASPWGIMLSGAVLILTPWIPTFWGFGDQIAASIVLVNVLAGSLAYKAFFARTE